MGLTIPYSGKPERPRRSNDPFIGGLVDQKHLLVSVKKQIKISATFIILNFKKNLLKINKKYKKYKNAVRNTTDSIFILFQLL